GDVSNSAQMKALIDEAVKQFGGLDIVVNSAGVRTNGSITEITEEQWDRTISVNLKGVFVISRLAIPEMIKRGGGVDLNIGSRSGMACQAGRAAYCASKGGMITLTEAMPWTTRATKLESIASAPAQPGLRWWIRRLRKNSQDTKPEFLWDESESRKISLRRRSTSRRTKPPWSRRRFYRWTEVCV